MTKSARMEQLLAIARRKLDDACQESLNSSEFEASIANCIQALQVLLAFWRLRRHGCEQKVDE